MGEATDFLYPFVDAPAIAAAEHDPSALLVDLECSAAEKITESVRLREATLHRWHDALVVAGTALAERFDAGGQLFTFGNGGSATDADATADLFRRPPHGRALPARSLVEDQTVLTALANDVGFDVVFARQLIAHARPGDVAVGFSTSGGSVNVIRAFEQARRRGLLTIASCGYDGGAMAASDDIDHCLIVASASIHRIQETQSALMFELWSIVQGALASGG
jgi:D-sedoheptulose 7-phosphate isomerase